MYNHLLDTFKTVAEEGSFTKAAEKSYLTHTAVRKQMNQLESYLGVKLFSRSTAGVTLTAAGKVLYAETLRLMKESDSIIKKVQAAYFTSPHTLRVGSSNLYPCYLFMDLWDRISARMPGWQLKVVPLESERNRLEGLGKDYDFIVGPYDSFPDGSPYAFQIIGRYRFTIAAARSNPLARRKEVRLANLEGQPLMVMERGTSPINDAIRKEIVEKHPGINIVDIPANYDIETFNRCAETGSLLLSLECWDRVHPEIKTIRLKEKYELPYGITYLKDSEVMQEYAGAMEETLDKNSHPDHQ